MKNIEYIKIPNPFKDGWFYKNEPYNKITAWVDLVLSAERDDISFKLNKEEVTIKQGQLITSVRACAFRWGWSKDKVTNFFKQLEKEKMIKRDCSVGMTVIRIINYDEMIAYKMTNDIQIPQMDLKILNDNSNEDTNDKPKKVTKGQTYYENDELNQAFTDFVDMRKKIKKPMTDRAVKMAKGKLLKYATNQITGEFDEDVAIKILEQSIMCGWTDLYQLKTDNRNKVQQSKTIDWSNI